jgi:hypothetical protein
MKNNGWYLFVWCGQDERLSFVTSSFEMYFALALYVSVQNGLKLLYQTYMEHAEVILVNKYSLFPSPLFYFLDLPQLNHHHSGVNLAENIMGSTSLHDIDFLKL